MTRTIAFLLASLAPVAAQAAQVAMHPVECTNLAPGECEAVGAVFATVFAANSGAQVAPPPRGEAAPPAAAEYLRVSAVRLASRIALHAALTRPDGSPIHAVDMTATSLDDLQPAADRMTRALVYRTSVEQTMTIKNVTRTEGARVNRTSTEKVIGFKTGFIMPVSLTSSLKLDPMMALQFDGRYEAETYFLEFGAGFAVPSDGRDDARVGYGGLFAEFGGSYYLTQANIGPYVGGGVIPRLFFGGNDGGVKLAGYLQGGLMFARTSSTRLYVELRLAQNFIPMEFGGEYQYDVQTRLSSRSNTTSVYPTELGLQVGIGW